MNHIEEIQGPSLDTQIERKQIIAEGDKAYFDKVDKAPKQSKQAE